MTNKSSERNTMGHNRFSLEGRRILVTGAAGGIGSAVARVCAELGAEPVLSDARSCGDVADALRADGHRAVETSPCDVRSRSAVADACARMGRIDAAVLNAGVNPWVDWEDAGYDEAFALSMSVNVLGPLNFARYLLPDMKARGGGRIVLMGSVAGWTGGAAGGVPPDYGIAKSGVHMLTRWLARRGGPEVLVNAVAPGPVRTAMTAGVRWVDWSAPAGMPVPRMAEADEVAWPIAFLCSPAASYVSGLVLDVCGGMVMR